MEKFHLPSIAWFVSNQEGRRALNTYSGSLGTQADRGCMNVPTLNYRAFVSVTDSPEQELAFVVEVFVIQPWAMEGERTDFKRATFACSDGGIRAADVWLSQWAADYGF